jgi:hypothetical protein
VEVTACDPLDIDALFTAEAGPIALHNDNGELSSSIYSSDHNALFVGAGQTCTLGSAGEDKQYYFSSLTTDADASVAIQGNVRLYVDGDLSLLDNSILNLAPGAMLTVYVSGEFFCDLNSQINNPGRPQGLWLYSDYASAYTNDYKLRLHTNTDLTGVIYAPRTAIEVNSNANFFGAVRGKYVYVHSGASFWYDEDLADPMSQPTITGFDVILTRPAD